MILHPLYDGQIFGVPFAHAHHRAKCVPRAETGYNGDINRLCLPDSGGAAGERQAIRPTPSNTPEVSYGDQGRPAR